MARRFELTQRIFEKAKQLRTDGTYSVPPLTYDYGALEPFVSAEIMEIHHKKHHQAYVTNLIKWEAVYNQLRESHRGRDKTLPYSEEEKVKYAEATSNFRFNAGGHLNHTFFWTTMCPAAQSCAPSSGLLKQRIDETFGDFEKMIAAFNAKTVAVQGSGWGWLGYKPESRELVLATTPNQVPLQPSTDLIPLIGIDVWEHAYYLQYKNMRADYLKEIWKIMNWDEIERRLVEAESQAPQ